MQQGQEPLRIGIVVMRTIQSINIFGMQGIQGRKLMLLAKKSLIHGVYMIFVEMLENGA
jgi:hypothetical protein